MTLDEFFKEEERIVNIVASIPAGIAPDGINEREWLERALRDMNKITEEFVNNLVNNLVDEIKKHEDEQIRIDLHRDIMNVHGEYELMDTSLDELKNNADYGIIDLMELSYKLGHRDARHAAAEIVLKKYSG